MWRWVLERPRLLLDLGAGGMAWQASGRGLKDWAGRRQWEGLPAQECLRAMQQEVAELAGQLPRGCTLEARLGLDLVPLWLQPPFQGSAHLPDWHQALQARAEQLFGPSADGWWVAADWAIDAPFPAGAGSAAWAEALRGSWPGPVECSALSLSLLQRLAALQGKGDDLCWFVIWQGSQYLMAVWRKGGWQLLDSGKKPCGSQTTPSSAKRLRQLAATHGVPAPDQVQWLDLDQADPGMAQRQDGVVWQPIRLPAGLRPWLQGAAAGASA